MSELIRGRISGIPGSDIPFSVDSGGNMAVALPGTIVAGQATVAGAGTPVALGTIALTSGVTVRALQDNAGTIFVGGFAVSDSTGYELDAAETVFMEVSALEQVWVDASSNGDKVSYIGG